MSTTHHTIIGLPKSGKTTFLAALYHLVDSGEVETKLKFDSYSGDHTYLNLIVRAWLECREVLRTSQAGDTNVELRLRNPETNSLIELAFPDLAGETFESQIALRTCHRDYVNGCNQEGGILLFISPNRPGNDGMTVVEQNEMVGAPEEDAAKKPAKVIPWTHKMMPTQVQLVELLQFMRALPFKKKIRRIAVIISAWDLIPDKSLEPAKWLEVEMPLLSQYLGWNKDAFDTRIFGVSALGGDIKNAEKKSELSGMTHSTRIVCIGKDCDAHDLTAPILWLTPDR